MAVGPLLAGWLAVYFFALPFLIGSAMCQAGAAFIYRFTPETVPGKIGRCPRIGGEEGLGETYYVSGY